MAGLTEGPRRSVEKRSGARAAARHLLSTQLLEMRSARRRRRWPCAGEPRRARRRVRARELRPFLLVIGRIDRSAYILCDPQASASATDAAAAACGNVASASGSRKASDSITTKLNMVPVPSLSTKQGTQLPIAAPCGLKIAGGPSFHPQHARYVASCTWPSMGEIQIGEGIRGAFRSCDPRSAACRVPRSFFALQRFEAALIDERGTNDGSHGAIHQSPVGDTR